MPPRANNFLYTIFMKRNSAFVATIFAGAFVAEIGFDGVSDGLWNRINQGKQWADIRDKYLEKSSPSDLEA